jgi:hypothetical protein
MKKIILFIVIWISSNLANAEQFEMFTSNEGINASISFISKSIINKNLIGITSINFSKNFYGTNYDFNFDVESGKSNCWIYYYTDTKNPTKVDYVPVVKIGNKFINFKKYCQDLNLENFAIPSNKINNFIDSDVFSSILLEKSTFKQLKSKHNQSEVDFVAVYSNQQPEYGKVNAPIWSVFYSDTENKESFACFSNAQNGELICEDFSKNKRNEFLSVELQKNKKVNVKTESNLKVITIQSSSGNTIEVSRGYDPIESILELDFSKIEKGVYFIIIKDKLEKSIVKYILE